MGAAEDWNRRLLERVPEFSYRFQDLVLQNEGEVFSYMIWADLCQFTVTSLTRAAIENEAASLANDLVARVAAFLEEAATSGDPEIENLVQVGFMEAMPQRGPARNAIVAQLGPKSTEFLTAAESY